MLNNLSDNQKRTLALAAMALLALACLCGTLAFTVDMVRRTTSYRLAA